MRELRNILDIKKTLHGLCECGANVSAFTGYSRNLTQIEFKNSAQFVTENNFRGNSNKIKETNCRAKFDK